MQKIEYVSKPQELNPHFYSCLIIDFLYHHDNYSCIIIILNAFEWTDWTLLPLTSQATL